MDLIGALSSAAGAGGAAEGAYIEDVFSTYLYAGNNPSSQTITNGIDLSGEGGLVWIKSRSDGTRFHSLYDTARGANLRLATNSTGAQQNDGAPSGLTFSSSGFVVADNVQTNESGGSLVSWTFRKAPKFFDVVTYTGTGSSQTISHSLDATVGMLIIKKTSATGNWVTFARVSGAAGATNYAYFSCTGGLNSTAAADVASAGAEAAGNITTTVFKPHDLSCSGDGGLFDLNASGATYVAYLFAHDAGGFGDDGEQNVITCGSYVGNGSATGPVVTLGYEPQWLLLKQSSIAGANWVLVDNMRGFTADGGIANLYANTTSEENSASPRIAPLSTGFQPKFLGYEFNQSGQTYIYIAIRRGPMKTPESGTEVYEADYGNATAPNYISGFPVDFALWSLPSFVNAKFAATRLLGATYLLTDSTGAEAALARHKFDYMNGWDSGGLNANYFSHMFRRAPGFMDVLAYTGTGSNPNVQTHNLGVAPELMIVKRRNSTANWLVATQFTASTFWYGYLDLDIGNTTSSYPSGVLNSQPTSTSFSIANTGNVLNASGGTYIAYLFATLAGISKVGSYTGTGTTLQINCGFSAGARFVLIKRADATGDWYVWDSARGIVSGDDPYLLLNSTAAEVTNTDYIDPLASGFEISSTAPAAINASGGTFIFLAIA